MGKCGRFFFRSTTLVSRGKSHSSRVCGVVVRCLLFNPEVSCSNLCVCANFLTSIPNFKYSPFLALWDSPFSTLLDFFFENFFSVLPSICFIFCNRTNARKSQRVPFFRFFGTMRLKFSHFFVFFFENFSKDSKRSPFRFLNFCNRMDLKKSQRTPFYSFRHCGIFQKE